MHSVLTVSIMPGTKEYDEMCFLLSRGIEVILGFHEDESAIKRRILLEVSISLVLKECYKLVVNDKVSFDDSLHRPPTLLDHLPLRECQALTLRKHSQEFIPFKIRFIDN